MYQNPTFRLTMMTLMVLLSATLFGQDYYYSRYEKDFTKEKRERQHSEYKEANGGERIIYKKVPHGFLGVLGDYKNQNKEGAALIVTENSRAAQAGLQTGDVILQINSTPIKEFNDVVVFMHKTKPNEVIQLKYQRDGEVKTTSATLEGRDNIWHTETEIREKDACLGVYSGTSRKENGSKISNFMEVSAAVEAQMKVGDVITGINGIGVNTHDELWDEIAKYRPKEKVSVQYLRNNEPQRLYATLKACKPKEEVFTLGEAKNDAPKININNTEQRQLRLDNFNASPNPIEDMVNIQFKADAIPTTIAFYDAIGRTLYQQKLNDFNGEYNQRFDVSAYAKGFLLVQITQSEKVFSKKLIVN
jgi:PDZ domain-containing secreted protein